MSGLKVHSLMDHGQGDSIFNGRYPTSRDWARQDLNVKCNRVVCVANYNNKCTMPSLIAIDPTGKCLGDKPRKKPV